MPYTPIYVSVDDVYQFLAIDGTDSNIASDVLFFLRMVEPLVTDYLNSSFVANAGAVKYLNGTGTQILTIDSPLTAITALEIVDSANTVISTITPYKTEPHNNGSFIKWIEALGQVFPLGNGNIKVTGNWGIATIPTAIQMATLLTVKYYMQERTHNERIMSQRDNERRTDYKSAEFGQLPEVAKKLLNKYKIYQLRLDK